jgi:hypothetical protein
MLDWHLSFALKGPSLHIAAALVLKSLSWCVVTLLSLLCHVCVGLQDADLLLLSLLCHEPYFIVMRENMEAGVSVFCTWHKACMCVATCGSAF